jgi:hypothetical protein
LSIRLNQTALQALEQEGLAIVRPRRGRVVRSTKRLHWLPSEFERPGHTVLSTSDKRETDIEGQGHDPTRQDLAVEVISLPRDIAARLAYRRRRAISMRSCTRCGIRPGGDPWHPVTVTGRLSDPSVSIGRRRRGATRQSDDVRLRVGGLSTLDE